MSNHVSYLIVAAVNRQIYRMCTSRTFVEQELVDTEIRHFYRYLKSINVNEFANRQVSDLGNREV